MRRIPLKTPHATTDDGTPGAEFPYAELMTMVLRAAPQGMSLDEMEIAVGAIAAVRKAKEANAAEVVLEEAQFAHLHSKVQAFRWGIADPAIIEFARDVATAEKFDAAQQAA